MRGLLFAASGAFAASLALAQPAFVPGLDDVPPLELAQSQVVTPEGPPSPVSKQVHKQDANNSDGVSALGDKLLAIMNERDRLYFQRLDALEKAGLTALTTIKEAVLKADAANEKRFESVNEFRNTLKDQQVTFAPKAEMDVRFKLLEERVLAVTDRLNIEQGAAAGREWLWGILIVAGGFAVGVIGLLFRIPPRPQARLP